MRRLRIVITAGSATLTAALLPLAEGCGTEPATDTSDAAGDVRTLHDARADASEDSPIIVVPDAGPDVAKEASVCQPFEVLQTITVPIPPAGTPADPGTLCSVATPATSNASAKVSFTSFSAQNMTATGFIAMPPSVRAAVVGTPTVTVFAGPAALLAMQVTNMTAIPTGYVFAASWPNLNGVGQASVMQVKVTYTIACGNNTTQTVEASTLIELCIVGDGLGWVSSGDSCTVCQIIAEMAPSPIPSDNAGDDLPLGRVVRLRVVELARAGRTLLLFAENDAGATAHYDWRVSGGSVEKVADDLLLWTLPETSDGEPFGQVGVWNDDGAAVENFYFGAA